MSRYLGREFLEHGMGEAQLTISDAIWGHEIDDIAQRSKQHPTRTKVRASVAAHGVCVSRLIIGSHIERKDSAAHSDVLK
jgi:hypothetical protein